MLMKNASQARFLQQLALRTHLYREKSSVTMVLSALPLVCLPSLALFSFFLLLLLRKESAEKRSEKDHSMSPFLLLLLLLLICAGVYGYMTYRTYSQRRARERKRNQYHDRV